MQYNSVHVHRNVRAKNTMYVNSNMTILKKKTTKNIHLIRRRIMNKNKT